MPTYEYDCDKCGHHFEQFQSMTAEPLKRCPKCKGKIRRAVGTGAGLIFRGSGFYQTDYRSDGYKSAAKKDVPTDAGRAEKAEKPEAKKKESKKASSGD